MNMNWKNILGIAVAAALVLTMLSAVPARAADAQSVRDRTYDAASGAWAKYHEGAIGTSNEGWTFYWWDNVAKGIHRQDPAKSVAYSHGGAPSFSAMTIAADTQYPDPGGWLYNSKAMLIQENATGYIAWSFTNTTGGTSPYTFTPYATLMPMPYVTSPAYSYPVGTNVVLNWNHYISYDNLGAPVSANTVHRAGYLVYRSAATNATWNQNPAMVAFGAPAVAGNVADWTLVGGTVAAPITTNTWTDVAPPVGTYYYCVKIVIDGTATPGGAASNVASIYGGRGSTGVVITPVGPATYPPEGSALTASPNPHNGNVAGAYDRVFLNATITDTEAPSDNIVGAEFQVELTAGVWSTAAAMTAVDGSFNSATEAVTGTFNFPSQFLTGAHNYRIRGQDAGDGWNATWTTGSFTVTDTTPAIASYNVGPTPPDGGTVYIGSTMTVSAAFEDIAPYNAANCILYYRQLGNGSWQNKPLNNVSFLWGSYRNNLANTIVPWGPVGTTIEYYVTVDEVGGPGLVTLATRTVITAQAAAVQDPYPIYGRVWLYNGNAGVFAPIIAGVGVPVTVAWVNSTTGLYSTIATTTIATGQYSVDILNYTDGGTVLINATFSAPYNNRGYNYTTISIAGFPGGREQNVMCGIPYDVEITAPAPLAIVTGGVAFPATYRFIDIDGVLAQGYYTHVDGQMFWRSGDPTFVPPAGRTFNGIGTAQPVTDNLVLNTAGNQWINISEGGAAELNPYLTPWGAIYRLPGNLGPLFLKDWDNITVTVQAGGFAWRLVPGWTLVSAPQNATTRVGANLFFDSQDALTVCFGVTADPNMKMATRTGGNPSTYVTYDYGAAEGTAFAVDSVRGYWVYKSTPGVSIVAFNAINWTAGLNVYNLAVGWNLVGYTHNYNPAGWTAFPTASDWTDGTVDADLNIAGALTKIVATQYLDAQWYNSYVVTDTFPGIGTHDWLWRPVNYSPNPGNGCWIWVSAVTQLNFNVNA